MPLLLVKSEEDHFKTSPFEDKIVLREIVKIQILV